MIPSLRTLALHRASLHPPESLDSLPEDLWLEVDVLARGDYYGDKYNIGAASCFAGDIWFPKYVGGNLLSYVPEVVASGRHWAVTELWREIKKLRGSENVDARVDEFYEMIIRMGAIFRHRHLIEAFLPLRTWSEDLEVDWFAEDSPHPDCIPYYSLERYSQNVGLTHLAIMEQDERTLTSFPLSSLSRHSLIGLTKFAATYRRFRSLKYLLSFHPWMSDGKMEPLIAGVLHAALRRDDLEMYRVVYDAFYLSNAPDLTLCHNSGHPMDSLRKEKTGDCLLIVKFGAERIFFHYAPNITERDVDDSLFQHSMNPHITHWLYHNFPHCINLVYALTSDGADGYHLAGGLLSLLDIQD